MAAASLALTVGCGAGTAPPPGPSAPTPSAATPTATAAPPEPDSALPDRDWGVVESDRFLLNVSLPDRGGWITDDRSGPWFRARHPASRSEILLRTWRAGRAVTHEQCERQARLWRPDLPTFPSEAVLDTRRLDAPNGYVSELTVGAGLSEDGQLEGFALLVGTALRRCLVFVFSTRAAGAHAEQQLGARLSLMSDGVLPELRARTVDDRGRGLREVR